MPDSKTLEQSYLLLVEFMMLSKRRMIELGSDCGLTGMQAMMLFMLDRPRPMNNFSKMFNCDASNITGIVDGLEQKDLVKRFENPEDRRVKMVELTSAGANMRSALIHNLTTRNNPLLSTLSDTEMKTFVLLLEKVTRGA